MHVAMYRSAGPINQIMATTTKANKTYIVPCQTKMAKAIQGVGSEERQ